MRRLGFLPFLPLAVLYLSSCATLPPPYSPADWLGLLPPESTVFAAADVAAAKGFLEAAAQRGLPAGQQTELTGVLERTHRLYGALSLVPGLKPSFSLVALGVFNPGAVSCRLGAGSDWRRHRLGSGQETGNLRARTYWEHRRLALELAVPQPGVVLVSNGGITRMLYRLGQTVAGRPSGTLKIPGEALATLERAALFAYLPSLPGGSGAENQGTSGTTAPVASPAPIQELWFAAFADPAVPGAYTAEAVVRLEEEKNPRLVENLFRLLLAAWLRRSGLPDPVGRLRGAQIVAEGREVSIRGLVLSGEDIVQLLGGYLPVPPE
jgi:hypothetical protein